MGRGGERARSVGLNEIWGKEFVDYILVDQVVSIELKINLSCVLDADCCLLNSEF